MHGPENIGAPMVGRLIVREFGSNNGAINGHNRLVYVFMTASFHDYFSNYDMIIDTDLIIAIIGKTASVISVAK
ncbi:MAG: hypothetical protein Tsb0027_17200 [Wenzhouxiangellaceae bacterium]